MLKTWVMKNIPYSMVEDNIKRNGAVCIREENVEESAHKTSIHTHTPPPFPIAHSLTQWKIKEDIEKSFSAARLCVLYFFYDRKYKDKQCVFVCA